MSGRRYSRKSKGTKTDDYGHPHRMFGVSSDTLSKVSKMESWIDENDWFDDDWMYENTNGKKRTRKKWIWCDNHLSWIFFNEKAMILLLWVMVYLLFCI
eukprot:1132368_1